MDETEAEIWLDRHHSGKPVYPSPDINDHCDTYKFEDGSTITWNGAEWSNALVRMEG